MKNRRGPHHDLFGSFGLLVLLAEIDDGVKVDFLGVLDYHLETTLVVIGSCAIFAKRDNDLLLLHLACVAVLHSGGKVYLAALIERNLDGGVEVLAARLAKELIRDR